MNTFLLLNLMPHQVHSPFFMRRGLSWGRIYSGWGGKSFTLQVKPGKVWTDFGPMSGEDGEKERLRATPLLSSPSKVQDPLSYINVASCYWLPRRLLGERGKENERKKKKLWERPRRGFDTTLIMRSRS